MEKITLHSNHHRIHPQHTTKRKTYLFKVSQLEDMLKGYVQRVDLVSLEENLMDTMKGSIRKNDLINFEENLMENMKNIASRIQNSRDTPCMGDDVFHDTQEDKDNVHVDQQSTNKNIPRGNYFINGSHQGWSPRVTQLPKIDIRNFDGNDPITWIF